MININPSQKIVFFIINIFFFAGLNPAARVPAVGSRIKTFKWPETKNIIDVRFYAGGEKMVCLDLDLKIRIRNGNTGRLLNEIDTLGDPAFATRLSPDGTNLVSIHTYTNSICIWDVATGKCIQIFLAQDLGSIILIDQKCTQIASLHSSSDIFQIIRLNNGEQPSLFSYGAKDEYEKQVCTIRTAAFSPDGTQIVTAHSDGKIRLLDIKSEKIICSLDYKTCAHSAAFSADGKKIVTTHEDGKIRIFDISTQKIRPLDTKVIFANDAVFSPNGRLLASTHRDNKIRIWVVRTGNHYEVCEVIEAHALQFINDKQLAVINDKKEIIIYTIVY